MAAPAPQALASEAAPAAAGAAEEKQSAEKRLVSVIVPMKNAAQWVDGLTASILAQTHRPLELSVYDDGSEDDTLTKLEAWRERAAEKGVRLVVSRESEDDRRQGLRGAGHARNRAARASSGEFLCFQDADDVMAPRRVELQLQSCLAHPEAIVGCSFVREPADSTPRYTNWCNSLSDGELLTHRFRDCTIIQPTWFMSRRVFERVGGYELLLGEDLLFFYRHIELGGTLVCVRDAPLLVYRYHAAQLSHRVPREYLRGLRAAAFERQILDQRSPFYHPRWASFTIWNAGRDGRAFFRLLSMENRRRVRAFCDVDPKLVGREYSNHGEPKEKRLKVPIVHWSEAQPPFVTCFTLDRNMQFERNLAARRLTPGVDVFFFC